MSTAHKYVEMSVSPALAQEWLGRSGGNRSIKRASVEKFARSMSRGEWVINGEAIKFDRNGRLIDGHHRLNAVVRSGATINTLVAYGLSADAITTIDTGNSRTLADIIAMDAGDKIGGKWSSVRAGMARTVALLMDGTRTISHAHFAEIEARFSEAFSLMLTTFKAAPSPIRRSPIMGAIAFAFRSNPDAVANFAQQVAGGEGLQRGDPALALRNAVFTMRRQSAEEIAHKTVTAAYWAIHGRPTLILRQSEMALDEFRKANSQGDESSASAQDVLNIVAADFGLAPQKAAR